MTDLLCPRCSTPSHPVAMRTRGEVRSRVWQCGCVIAPEVRVESFGVLGERLHVARGHAIEELHPTEAGAIAAWRVALEQRQREDDERVAQPAAPAGEAIGPQPWQRGALRSVLRAAAVRRSHAEVLAQIHPRPPSASLMEHTSKLAAPTREEAPRSPAGPTWDGMVAAVEKGLTPAQYVAGCEPLSPATLRMYAMAGAHVRDAMLAREREALATLPTRTDDEVRQVTAACTEATHVETLVAVANECARRWPSPRWGIERPTFCVETSGAIGGTWAPSGDAWFPTAASVIKVMRRLAGVA